MSEIAENTCKFCEWLERLKENDKKYEGTSKFSVALVQQHYYRGQERGNAKYCGYELNFCPECGAKMDEDKL